MKTREKQIDFLNSHYSFPCRIAFILNHKDGQYRILTQEYRNKKKQLDNIRFGEIQTFMLDGSSSTTLGVQEIESADKLIDVTDGYVKSWTKEDE